MSRLRARIKVLPRAIQDTAEQAAYYRQKASPEVAKRWRKSVNDAVRSLRTFPVRSPLVKPADTESRGLRKLHLSGFPAHLIFYRYEAGINTVFIVRILHGARDADPLLR